MYDIKLNKFKIKAPLMKVDFKVLFHQESVLRNNLFSINLVKIIRRMDNFN